MGGGRVRVRGCGARRTPFDSDSPSPLPSPKGRGGKTMKLLALLTLLLAPASVAQIPSHEQLSRDLASPFAATQAAPALNRRGELSRRVERLLIQQTRYLASTLHQWSQ